ncbi:MAG: hypothetical protein WCS42_10055, partial [Verrucomicrobiota bacterium]
MLTLRKAKEFWPNITNEKQMKIKLNLLVAVCFAAAVSVEAQVVNYNNTVASPDTIASWGPGG